MAKKKKRPEAMHEEPDELQALLERLQQQIPEFEPLVFEVEYEEEPEPVPYRVVVHVDQPKALGELTPAERADIVRRIMRAN